MTEQFPLDLDVLREVLDYVNMGVYITDTERHILLWNRKAEEITGYPAKDVVGIRCEDNVLNHKDKNGDVLCTTDLCPLRRSILIGKESGEPILVYARKADGRRIPVLVNTAPLRDKKGKIIGGIEAFRDASREVRDLELAREVQSHLLPKSLPATGKIRFDVRYYPHGQVGGDFYDVIRAGDDGVGVFLADVRGHGVSAALYTMLLKGMMESHSALAADPSQFIAAVNRNLGPFLVQGAFASAFYAVVDVAQNRVTFANAGHPPALLFRAKNGEVERITVDGMLLGILPDSPYAASGTRLSPGDVLLCYTDGAVEVPIAGEKMLDTDGLSALLAAEAPKDPATLLDRLYQQLRDLCDEVALPDDALLLSVRRVE